MTDNNHLNPTKALEAILSPDIIVNLDNGGTLSVKPISISTLAVLDSIQSPILKPTDTEPDMITMLITLYVCLNGYKVTLTTNSLMEDTLNYFDNLNITNNDYQNIYKAVLTQYAKLLNIQPEVSDKKKDNT